MVGRRIRLARISRNDRYLLVPMDHGVSVGPIQGLERPLELIATADESGATGVILHKGLMPQLARVRPRLGSLVHVSSSTMQAPDPDEKRIVATVEDAVRLGADGLSVHVNVGSKS